MPGMRRTPLLAVVVALILTARAAPAAPAPALSPPPTSAAPAPPASRPAITTVIIVRHAEKRTEQANADGTPVNDMEVKLDADGVRRAADLARVLGDAGIDQIYTSQKLRTQETAAPLAKQTGAASAAPVPETDADGSATLADVIRHKNAGQTVLVVWHADKIPPLIKRLGGPANLPQARYDDLFLCTLAGDACRVTRLHYGLTNEK
jgi:broad specificity phosphatase PhoE